jgi:hypothetical protein
MDGGVKEILRWPVMRARTEQAMSKNRELEMAQAGGGRRREYMLGLVVTVCGSNLDYRWPSNPGWSYQPVLKV